MNFIRHPEQPICTDLSVTDDIFVKSYLIPMARTIMPQHAHSFSHVSVIARGGVKVWIDGDYKGERHALSNVTIEALKMHTFMTTEDNTVILCVHNIGRNGDIEVAAENGLVPD